jgi:hypothetical protein
MNTQSAEESTLPSTMTPLLRWRLLLVIRGFAPETADRLARLKVAIEDGALGGPNDQSAADSVAPGSAGERDLS